MSRTVLKALRDLLSKDVLWFLFKTSLISLLISGAIIYKLYLPLKTFLASFLTWLPFDFVSTTGAWLGSATLLYLLFFLIHSLVTAFMSEKLIKKLAAKHYPNTPANHQPSLSKMLLVTLKSVFVFLALLLVSFPLIFVPIAGQIWLVFLLSILINKPTFYEIASLFYARDEMPKQKGYTPLAMLASALGFIPFLNMVAPLFAQLLAMHKMLGKQSHTS